MNTATGSSKSSKRLLWVLLAVFLACACLVAVSAAMLAAWTYIDTANVHSSAVPDAWVDLAVAPDGCRVERGEVQGSDAVRSLTWVVADEDGGVLLERSAEGELAYSYFQAGAYRVHLKAWYGDRYHVLSDEVAVRCP